MISKKKEISRLDYIDILRGIGIIIMIMGHIGFGGKFDRYIHSFHMPLFFMVSGYFFKVKTNFSFREFYIRKAKQLLIPYVSFGLIHYVIWLIYCRTTEDVFSPLARLVTYNTERLPIAGALWFFTALFFVDVIYANFVYRIKNQKIAGAIVLIISVITSAITTYTEFRLPLTLDIALVAIGFYHVGRLLCKVVEKWNVVDNIELKPVKFLLIGTILLLINAIVSFINGYVNMKSGWYAFIPLTWFNIIIGVASFFIFAVWCDKKVGIAKNILSFIGRNSIIYLCLNQLVILILSNVIGLPIGNTGVVTLKGIGISSIITIITIIVLSCCVLLFNNTPLKKLIGK